MNSLVKILQDEPNKTFKKEKSLENENIKINSLMHNLRKGISKETLEKIKKAKEPTWIAITQWSECSKTCGGGKSYLQRICIVPKNSKEHCEGNRIVFRECNTIPCDGNQDIVNVSANNTYNFNNTMSISGNNIKEISVTKSPKKTLISKKTIKYERCMIKEGDLILFINDGDLKGTKIPVRVVLNNSTLNAYSSDVINISLRFKI
jgi:hypothetical protein